MENNFAHKKANKHEWGFMGADTETGEEYAQCDHCGKFCMNDVEPHGTPIGGFVPRSKYIERCKLGKIDIDGHIMKPEEVL